MGGETLPKKKINIIEDDGKGLKIDEEWVNNIKEEDKEKEVEEENKNKEKEDDEDNEDSGD